MSLVFNFSPTKKFTEKAETSNPQFTIHAQFATLFEIENEQTARDTMIVNIGLIPEIDLSK